jgi:putative tricarboxylic transport membrane protein
MTEQSHNANPGPSQRGVELGVAAFTALFGIIVIIGSLQAGIGWGIEGPKAGFFPFYLGVVIVISSVFNAAQVILANRSNRVFAEWQQLRQVLAVVVPTAVYVALVPVLGIYLSSALLIAAFMRRLGRYPWGMVLAISIGVPLAFYFMFEKWFLVPLPKGPIEDWLGL